jgi:hypothetical protein
MADEPITKEVKSKEEGTKNVEDVTGGDLSLTQYVSMVRQAWDDEFNFRGWVIEVFIDRAIVLMDKKHWLVPFTADADEIQFAANNEWTEVEGKFEWIEKSFPIKSLSDDRIGGVATLWGDEDHKDLTGEFFTKNTDELTTIFDAMGKIPFLFEHATDELLKTSVIAEIDTLEEKEIGLWFEAKIKEHAQYRDFVKPLIDSEALYPSSGTLPAAKQTKKSTGEILMLETPIDEIKSHYESIGLKLENETNDAEEEAEVAKGVEKARLEALTEQSKLRLRLLKINVRS